MNLLRMNPSRPARPSALARALFLAAAILLPLAATPAVAHRWTFTEVVVGYDPDGYVIEFHYDLDAMMVAANPGHMSEEIYQYYAEAWDEAKFSSRLEEVRAGLRRHLRVRLDGEVVEPTIEFPDLGKAVPGVPGSALVSAAPPDTVSFPAPLVGDAPASDTARLPTALDSPAAADAASADPDAPYLPPGGPWPAARAILRGPLPEGVETLSFQASRMYGPVTLRQAEAPEADMILVLPGQPTDPLPVRRPAPPQGALRVALDYAILGFEHILPKGLDHILFVLGLFLLDARLRPLLWQVTAFTLAHSATLALSIGGVVSLPSRPVETIIAFSIAWIGIENLATAKMQPWRPFLVFAFGLLHGLGFAGVLQELGLPEGRRAVALIAFNVGVEFGQLAVLGLAFLAVGWFRDRPWYRNRIVIPASASIAAVAIWWTIERGILGG